jgi:hypothetical protein
MSISNQNIKTNYLENSAHLHESNNKLDLNMDRKEDQKTNQSEESLQFYNIDHPIDENDDINQIRFTRQNLKKFVLDLNPLHVKNDNINNNFNDNINDNNSISVKRSEMKNEPTYYYENQLLKAILFQHEHLPNRDEFERLQEFQEIKGVGPIYAKKLIQSDINTIEEIHRMDQIAYNKLLEEIPKSRLDSIIQNAKNLCYHTEYSFSNSSNNSKFIEPLSINSLLDPKIPNKKYKKQEIFTSINRKSRNLLYQNYWKYILKFDQIQLNRVSRSSSLETIDDRINGSQMDIEIITIRNNVHGIRITSLKHNTIGLNSNLIRFHQINRSFNQQTWRR